MILHHVALRVADVAASERFYAGVLDLPVLRRWPDGEGGLRSVWVGDAESFLALERGMPAAGDARESPLATVALRIAPDARAAWEERLAAAGCAIERRTDWTIYCRDPDGHLIGLSHWPDAAPPSA